MQGQQNPFLTIRFSTIFQGRIRKAISTATGTAGTGPRLGVIVSEDGYIVTNNHVVEQADELMVLLGDKRNSQPN